jgi:hypothetical protein
MQESQIVAFRRRPSLPMSATNGATSMTTCTHPDLHIDEGTHYCCATCGQRFVVMRVNEPQAVDAVDDQAPSAPEHVDVSGKIGRYVLPDRRLPSKTTR